MQPETDVKQLQPVWAGWGGFFYHLDRVLDRVIVTLSYVAAIILIFMTISVGYDVVMRYFLNRPTRWAVEFSEYMLLYMAFLPGAWVLKKERHVKIDLVLQCLPSRVQTVFDIGTSGVGTLLCAVFTWSSAALTLETFRSKEVLFRAVHVPKWAVLVVIPVGLLLLTLEFARRTTLSFNDLRNGKSKVAHGSEGAQIPEVD